MKFNIRCMNIFIRKEKQLNFLYDKKGRYILFGQHLITKNYL